MKSSNCIGLFCTMIPQNDTVPLEIDILRNDTIFLDDDGLLPNGRALEVKSRAEHAAKLGRPRKKHDISKDFGPS